MEQVETLPESPSLSEDPLPKTSPEKSSKENGIRVSPNGKEVGSDVNDLGGSGEVVDGTGDAVHLGDGGEEMSHEDFEVNNGASSLLEMQGSKGLHGLDSVLDVMQLDEDLGVESGNGEGVSPVVDLGGDVNVDPGSVNVSPGDVKEKGHVDEGLGSETLVENDGKISRLSGGKSEEVKQDSGDDDHDFGIGDFVWGKIKSHPWWPGRIYDPSDASDSACKVKQRDKILVGYFGDHTFAWCNSSQLKPLDENFEKMSAQSNAKIFVNAVDKAMDDVGRLVDLEMTCACVPKGNLIGFGRTLSKNAGIKEGLLIPEGGIDKFSSTLFEPIQILGSIKDTAQIGTATNKLELTVVTSWLSAFYRTKGGHQLPFYNDPKLIEGLEDKSGDWVVDLSNYSNGGDVRVQGPIEEDWLSSPRKQEQPGESMLRKCQGGSEAGHYQRRKQKSLAKILEGPIDTEAENQDDEFTEGGAMSSNLTSSANRKKRKSMGENMNADAKIEAVDATQVEAASSAGKKKRKANDEVDAEGKTKRGRKKRKVTSDADTEDNKKTEDVANAGATTPTTPAPGGKKRKGKKLSEFVTEENAKLTGLDANASGVKKDTVKTPSSRGRKKKGSSDVKDDGSASAKKVKSNSSNKGKVKEQITDGSLLRERKRSKYLSPPYTNIDRGQKKNEVEAEYLKVSGEARLAEKMTKAASQLICSPSILKPSGEKVQKKSSKKQGAGHATSDISGTETPKQDSNIIADPMMASQSPKQDTNNIFVDPMMVKAPASEVLSKMRSAALNPTSLKETNSVNAVEEFVSAFRNSSYCTVLDGEYRELSSGKKRKLQKSEAGSSIKEQYKSDQSSADQKFRPTKSKKKEAKMDKPKTKEVDSAPEMNTKENDESEGAVLYASFGPGSNLPTKNDLIQMYGKYGALNEQDTEMFYTNFCARIVFLNSSAGEEAFNESLLSSPFESATVTFRLHYGAAETKTREVREISSNEVPPQAKERAMTTQGMPSGSQSSDSNESQLNFVRQRLETIALLVESSVGKIAPDMKSTLEGEMKVVLEKVISMVDGSS